MSPGCITTPPKVEWYHVELQNSSTWMKGHHIGILKDQSKSNIGIHNHVHSNTKKGFMLQHICYIWKETCASQFFGSLVFSMWSLCPHQGHPSHLSAASVPAQCNRPQGSRKASKKNVPRGFAMWSVLKESITSNYHGNPQPSFLGVITHILYLGIKNFIFHGFRVQG